jgi:hypothetical protein
MSVGFPRDVSGSSHSFVSTRIGGVVDPKAAVERDVAGPVDAIAPVEDAVRSERLEPRAERRRDFVRSDLCAAAAEQPPER